MIINLPNEISRNELEKFDFGNIEANDDNLLFDSVCQTSAILEFKNGKKNIVLGEKGTGKTALFRLLKEKKIKFNQYHGYKNIIIPIEDNFQYKNIKGKILKLIETDITEDNFKYQIVWELYIFYRILKKIKSLNIAKPNKINEAISLSENMFTKEGIDKFIKNKFTIGIRLYDTQSLILPDLYYTQEPIVNLDDKITKKNIAEKLEVDLDLYKEELNQFLIKNNLNLIILIDRLDEFVSKNSLNIQIDMLEALIAVEREYGRYSNIELKIFLRDDLFNQLSFDGIGYDKIISKKVDLIWEPTHIREFIAKRLYNNFKQIYKLESLRIRISDEYLEVDTSIDTENFVKPNYIVRLYRKILKKIKPQQYASKHPRKVNLNDNINKEVILAFFPKYVTHVNGDGKKQEIDIFDFFSNKFNLGTGNTIPRLILIFLQKLLLITKNYYLNNFDELPIKKNDNNYYEIFKKGFFIKAYEEFKNDIYISYSKLNPDFEKKILLLKEKIGYRYSFSAKEIKNLLNIENDTELYHFCNYLLHIGLLKRTNRTASIENMKFILPEMFRNTKT